MTNSNTQVKAVQDQMVVGQFTQAHLDTLKGTIAKGTSNEQFQLFMQTCVRTGLDPFLNQIYCIVYNGTMSIQIAVEGIVALAKKHPGYKGFIASEVYTNDYFKISMQNGEVEHEPNIIDPGDLIAAYCVAYRDGAPPVAVVIRISQVDHLIKGKNSMWKDYKPDMIVKHAIKRSFKRQFGIEVSEDEMAASPDPIDKHESYNRMDVTPPVEEPKLIEDTKQRPDPEPAEVNPVDAVRDEMKALFKQLGIISKKEMQDYIQRKGEFNSEQPTVAEMKGLVKIMKMEVEDLDSNLPV